MQFDPMNFINNLKYMGLGMLGIFVVLGIIILITLGLGHLPAGEQGENK